MKKGGTLRYKKPDSYQFNPANGISYSAIEAAEKIKATRLELEWFTKQLRKEKPWKKANLSVKLKTL